jgi:fumarate hydratase subunit beta
MKEIATPLTAEVVADLRSGDQVLITGTIYVGRDAAHKRLVALLEAKQDLPFDPQGQIIYYMGPAPAKPGQAIGSAGPTTSYRMDPYTVPMLQAGLKGMIGKGNRSSQVRQALQDYKAVYFAAIGGAGALISNAIVEAEVIAYPDLGAEALRELQVVRFPAIVVNDIYGGDAYEEGKSKYRMEQA